MRTRVFQTLVLLTLIGNGGLWNAYASEHPPCAARKILDQELTGSAFIKHQGAFIHGLQAHLIRVLSGADNSFLTHVLNMEPNELLRIFHTIMIFLERAPGETTADPLASQHLIEHPMTPALIKAHLMSAEALIHHEIRRKQIPFDDLVQASMATGTFVETCRSQDTPRVIGKFINSLMSRDHQTRSHLEQLILGAFYRLNRVSANYQFATGDRLATPHENRKWDPVFDFVVYKIDETGNLLIHTMGEVKHQEHFRAIRQMQTSIQRIRRLGLRIDGRFFPPEKIWVRAEHDGFKPLAELSLYPNDTHPEALKQTFQFRHAMVHLFMATNNASKFTHIEDWGDVEVGTVHHRGQAQRIAFIGGLTPFLEAIHYLVLFYMTQPQLQSRIRQLSTEYHFTYDHFIRSYLRTHRTPPPLSPETPPPGETL